MRAGTIAYLYSLFVYFSLLEYSRISAIPVSPNTNAETMKIPAMARKAGGSWRPELVAKPAPVDKQDTPEVVIKKHDETEEDLDFSEEKQDSSYYYDDVYDSEEQDCPRGQYFHVRLKECVPNRCYGGERWRMYDGHCYPKYIVDYNIERKMYPGRFQNTYSQPNYVYRGRGPVSSQTRHMTFLGKKKGPFTG